MSFKQSINDLRLVFKRSYACVSSVWQWNERHYFLKMLLSEAFLKEKRIWHKNWTLRKSTGERRCLSDRQTLDHSGAVLLMPTVCCRRDTIWSAVYVNAAVRSKSIIMAEAQKRSQKNSNHRISAVRDICHSAQWENVTVLSLGVKATSSSDTVSL